MYIHYVHCTQPPCGGVGRAIKTEKTGNAVPRKHIAKGVYVTCPQNRENIKIIWMSFVTVGVAHKRTRSQKLTGHVWLNTS